MGELFVMFVINEVGDLILIILLVVGVFKYIFKFDKGSSILIVICLFFCRDKLLYINIVIFWEILVFLRNLYNWEEKIYGWWLVWEYFVGYLVVMVDG